MSQIDTAYDPIYGVHQGVYYGQNERVDELNDRISTRWFPDLAFAPNFDPRPVPTKYEVLPIINHRAPPVEGTRIQQYPPFDVMHTFNPGNSKAPVQGYLSNVDIETKLLNLGTALQHGADQGVYVPSSNSDMYKITPVEGSLKDPQPFQNLFTANPLGENARASRISQKNIGQDIFMNHTRTQLRGSVA